MAVSRNPSLAVDSALRFPFSEHGRAWVVGVLVAAVFLELIRNSLIPFSGLIVSIGQIVLWLMIYRVASEVLLVSAEGRTGAPNLHAFQSADGLAIRHVGLWLVATLALAAIAIYTGPVGLVVGSIAIAAILPAATIVLTLSRSLLEALVPGQWFRLAVRIGWSDYARLFGMLLAASTLYLLLAWVIGRFGAGASVRNVVMLTYWAAAVLGWFHLAGCAVDLHRDELNLIEPDTEPDNATDVETFTHEPEALWQQIRSQGGTRAMHAELARQLDRSGNRERRLEHGRMHIEALILAFEDYDAALERAGRLLEVDPAFALAGPDAMYALVQASTRHGHPALTARLCANFLENFPNSVKCNSVRLAGCEALAGVDSSRRRMGEQWYRQLMTARLDDTQRERLTALAPRYLDPGPDRAV